MKNILIILGVLLLLSATTKITYDYTREAPARWAIVKHFSMYSNQNSLDSESKTCYKAQKYISEKFKTGWILKDISINSPTVDYRRFGVTVVLIKY